MAAFTPSLELTDVILEVGGSDMLACMQCGTCTAVCPWPLVRELSPRHVVRQASLGAEGYEQEDLWKCVTCATCVTRCPRGLDVIDVMRACRAVMLEAGAVPSSYATALGSLRTDGNPWGGERKDRTAWARDLEIPTFTPDLDYLYFTCCSQAHDPRNRRVARALVRALRAGGVRFGVLDERESCCGDQARKVGAEDVWETLRSGNVDLLREVAARRVLVASPHCLQVFNIEYARELPVHATHYTQLLARLLEEGALRPTRPVEERVAYHDPCYLGRHAGEYEAPRRVLAAIPGLTLLEMPRNRENALCCGGGGGGLWSDAPPAERFALLRVREAQETGARVIATACPYCTAMLEDAVKVLDLDEQIRVQDVAELVAAALPEAK